jgi:hypothetical protein
MDTFYQVLGFEAAFCIGIMVLTAFFTPLGYFNLNSGVGNRGSHG